MMFILHGEQSRIPVEESSRDWGLQQRKSEISWFSLDLQEKKIEYISCIKGFSSTKPKTLFGWGKHHVSTIPFHIWADKRLEIKQGGYFPKHGPEAHVSIQTLLPSASFPTPGAFFESLRALLGLLLWPSTPNNSMGRDTQGAEGMAADTAHQAVTGRGFKSKWGTWLWFYLKMHPALPQTCQYLEGAYQNQNGLLWSDCSWSGTPEEKSLYGHAHVLQHDRTNSQSVCAPLCLCFPMTQKRNLP